MELEHIIGGQASSERPRPESDGIPETQSDGTILSEAELNGIFERYKEPQEWYVDKLLVRKTASCCSCSAGMPEGKLYVHVKGRFVPKDQTFAVERVFYFCAIPRCLGKKPKRSNISVPPSRITMATKNLLVADVAMLRQRGLNIV